MPTIIKSVKRAWQPDKKPQTGRQFTNSTFYSSTPWRKLRAIKLKQTPLCEECIKFGKLTPALVVDHIKPINQGGGKLDLNNLQSMCAMCHNKKSGAEAHQ